MHEKIASDIYRLAMIKVACYEAGYDIRHMSREDMEKIAAINFPQLWGHIKGFGSSVATVAKNKGRGVIGGLKQLPNVINVAVKDPNFAKASLYRALAQINPNDISKGLLPSAILDEATGGIGGNLSNVIDGLDFINRLGNNMKGFSEYGRKVIK